MSKRNPTSRSSPLSTNVNPKKRAPKNATTTCRIVKCAGIFSTSLSLRIRTSVAISSIFAIVNRIQVMVCRLLFVLRVVEVIASLFGVFQLVLERQTCS